jgi:hypothetical protein
MEYFRLLDNINYPQRWYLGDIVPDDNNWKFTYANKVDEALLSNDLKVEVYKSGIPMDYTTTEAYVVPIVSVALKQALEFVKDVQFLPVKIEEKLYYIMVICSVIACLDESESEFEKYTENDLVGPDKAGDYKSFYKMKIDEKKVGVKNIFRLGGYDIAIIVSEKVKKEIENINSLTAKFKEV